MTSRRAARLAPILIACAAVACGSPKPRPWQPSYTAATDFEGARIELASGYLVEVSCRKDDTDDRDYPLFGCTRVSDRESRTYVSWRGRRFELAVANHVSASESVPRLRAVHVRRLAPGLVVFDVRARSARWRSDVFLCLETARGCQWGTTPLALPPAASLEDARAQAIARRWDPLDLDSFFGSSPRHHRYALEHLEWSYLELRWSELAPDLRQQALSAAIATEQERFLKEHWDDLDAANVQRALELFVRKDRYELFGSDPWWARLSPAAQQHLLQLAIDGPASLERERFLGHRYRATGDPRLHRAMQRRW